MINEWKFLRLCSYFNKMVLYFLIYVCLYFSCLYYVFQFCSCLFQEGRRKKTSKEVDFSDFISTFAMSFRVLFVF